jgi:hypothetical protein
MNRAGTDLHTQREAGFTKRTLVLSLGVVIMLFLIIASFTSGGSKAPQKPTISKSAQGFVKFPAWGVRAHYDGSLKLEQTTTGNRAVFSSRALTELDKSCAGHGGTIARFKPDEDISPSGGDGVVASALPQGHGAFSFTTTNNHADIDVTGSDYTYAYVKGRYYIYYPDTTACGDYDNATLHDYYKTTGEAVKSLTPTLEAGK